MPHRFHIHDRDIGKLGEDFLQYVFENRLLEDAPLIEAHAVVTYKWSDDVSRVDRVRHSDSHITEFIVYTKDDKIPNTVYDIKKGD